MGRDGRRACKQESWHSTGQSQVWTLMIILIGWYLNDIDMYLSSLTLDISPTCYISPTIFDIWYLLSVMSEREHVIDFTVPYYDLVGITIMMKKPKVSWSRVKMYDSEDLYDCLILLSDSLIVWSSDSAFWLSDSLIVCLIVRFSDCQIFWLSDSLIVRLIVRFSDCQVPTSLFKFLSVLEESVWGCILVWPHKHTYHHHHHHHLWFQHQNINDDM